MKKNISKLMLSLLAVVVAAAAMMCATGCFTGMLGYAPAVPSDTSVGTEEFDEDDRAAADTLKAYFDAFAAKDAEAMADFLCSECRLNFLNQENGSTRDDFVKLMQDNLNTVSQEYGENAVTKYDPESFRSKSADEFIETLNDGLKIDTEAGPVIDAARIISADVWVDVGDGVEKDRETGSMLVYRYDGQWYIYGYAG